MKSWACPSMKTNESRARKLLDKQREGQCADLVCAAYSVRACLYCLMTDFFPGRKCMLDEADCPS